MGERFGEMGCEGLWERRDGGGFSLFYLVLLVCYTL